MTWMEYKSIFTAPDFSNDKWGKIPYAEKSKPNRSGKNNNLILYEYDFC